MSGTNRLQGEFARLISPRIFSSSGYNNCSVQFWYHMYGSHIRTLNVYTKPAGAAEREGNELQWTLSGEQGLQWRFAKFFFVSESDFQVSW